jgi:hypothetical protein
MSQQKTGIRHMIIPGARYNTVVAIRLIAVMMEEALTISTPTIHKSIPEPGLPVVDSGA